MASWSSSTRAVEDKHDLRPARGDGLRELQTLSHTVKKLICASSRRQAVKVAILDLIQERPVGLENPAQL
jgi:hypothetical protein